MREVPWQISSSSDLTAGAMPKRCSNSGLPCKAKSYSTWKTPRWPGAMTKERYASSKRYPRPRRELRRAPSAARCGAPCWGCCSSIPSLVSQSAGSPAGGATAGALTDIGINDDLIRRIGQQLQPGKAAVFALIRRSTPDKVTEALKQYHPTVLHTNLTKHREEDLVKALQP